MTELTLLQREVIRRLRAGGYEDLAKAAKAAWRAGKRLTSTAPIVIADPSLKTDFDRANDQSTYLIP